MRHDKIEKQYVYNPELLALYEQREAISAEVKLASLALHLANQDYQADMQNPAIIEQLQAANVGYLAMISRVTTLNETILRTEHGL